VQLCATRAFTLIELILCIAIMAIVLIAMNAVFFSAFRLREHTDRVIAESMPVEQTLETIRRDLLNAIPPMSNGVLSGSFKVGGVTSMGVGEPVDIEFYTTTGVLRDNEPWGDVQKVTYGLRQSANAAARGRDLVRGVTRNLLASMTPQPSDQWMVGGIESIEFSCYDGMQWRSYWDTTLTDTNLPSAVRVRLVLSNPDDSATRGRPVEMVVPIDSPTAPNQTQ
jgi:type II secretion system protein J